jgi:APA family basic amino acid/polyamine antiporter
VILVLLLAQSRIFFAMARDGLLPSFFANIHPEYHTPWYSTLALMVFTGAFGAFASLSMVGNLTSMGALFAFVIVCLGVLIMRYRHPELPRSFRVPWVPFVPVMGILICLLMMISLGWDTWVRLLAWLFFGLVIYFFHGRFKRA